MKKMVVFACLITCLASAAHTVDAHAESASFGTSRKLKLREASATQTSAEKAPASELPIDTGSTRAQLDPNQVNMGVGDTTEKDQAPAPKFGVNRKHSLRSANHSKTSSAVLDGAMVSESEPRAQLDIDNVAEATSAEQSQFGSTRKTSQRVNSKP